MRPITVIPESSVAALVVAMGRFAQSLKSSMGSAVRRSCRTKRTPATTKTAAGHRAEETVVPAWVNATISAAMATVNSAAPSASTVRVRGATSSRR